VIWGKTMAVGKCRECGNVVSTEAAACPHCGAPKPTKKPVDPVADGCAVLFTAMLVVGLAALGIYYLVNRQDQPSNPSENSQPASQSPPDKVAAWTMAEEFVKKHLKSPSTADFGSVFGDYQNPEKCTTDLGNGEFDCHGWVDAENSFGAKLRTNWDCRLKFVGNDKWEAESVKIDSENNP
jgi:hypothetical protein